MYIKGERKRSQGKNVWLTWVIWVQQRFPPLKEDKKKNFFLTCFEIFYFFIANLIEEEIMSGFIPFHFQVQFAFLFIYLFKKVSKRFNVLL